MIWPFVYGETNIRYHQLQAFFYSLSRYERRRPYRFVCSNLLYNVEPLVRCYLEESKCFISPIVISANHWNGRIYRLFQMKTV